MSPVLIFCHLFVGLSLGLMLYAWIRNDWIIFALAVGAILPDLIDKPIGYLLLNESLANGRIFFHGLLAVGIMSIGAIISNSARYFILLAGLALGMLSHQILDAMWLDPVSWFFPLLGAYIPDPHPNYFLAGLVSEITSPTEWFFGLLSVSILVLFVRDRFRLAPTNPIRWMRRMAPTALWAGPWILGMAGGVILMYVSLTYYPDPKSLTEAVMLGVTCLLTSIFLLAYFPRGSWIGREPRIEF